MSSGDFNPAIKMLDPRSLVPNPNNPRTHDKDQIDRIARSIRAFGFNSPILLHRGNNIVAGHGRCMAAIQCGLELVPTIDLSHLTADEALAYLLADNKTAHGARTDVELEAAAILQLAEAGIAWDVMGYTKSEAKRLASFADPDGEDGGDQSSDLAPIFEVVISCADEAQQRVLLDRLTGEGLKCRALVS